MREITQALDKSDLVVEGKVIKAKGIWDRAYTGVFTSYTVIAAMPKLEISGVGLVFCPKSQTFF